MKEYISKSILLAATFVALVFIISVNKTLASEFTGSFGTILDKTTGSIEGTAVAPEASNPPSNPPANPPSGGGSPGGSVGGGGGPSAASTRKLGDINADGKVDKYDFSLMMANWGKTGTNASDLNGDGRVDKYDFALLMSGWGK